MLSYYQLSFLFCFSHFLPLEIFKIYIISCLCHAKQLLESLVKFAYYGGTHARTLHAHALPCTAVRLLVGVARFISGSISQIAAPAARGACD